METPTGRPAIPGSRVRSAALAAAALLALAASGMAARFHLGEARWLAASRADLAQWAITGEPAGRGPLWGRVRGRELSQAFFPTQWDAVAEAYGQSLLADPRAARTWLLLAEAELFRGNPDHARAALARSDALNPNFPRQRREAIRLWLLLGERERALGLVRQLASLGGSAMLQAVSELSASRVPFDEAVAALPMADLRGAEAAELLAAFTSAYPGTPVRELVAAFPESARASGTFRRAAVAAALDRRDLADAAAWWTEAATPDAPPDDPPWRNAWPLGWQVPGETLRGTVAWDAATGTGRWTINLRLRQRCFWPMYRMVLPEGEARRVELEVRATPPGRSQIYLAVDGVALRPARPDTTDWQRLTLEIPASESDRLLTVSLLRDPLGSTVALDRPQVLVRNLSIEAIPPAEAAP